MNIREFVSGTCNAGIGNCIAIIGLALQGLFFSGPLLAIKNMVLPRYIIIASVFLLLWIISYFIDKKYQGKSFFSRGWILGIRGFWITTFIFHKIGFPIPARELPSCGACGGDYPPYNSLLPTIGNILIWQIIGISISHILKLQKRNLIMTIFIIATIWLILFGFSFIAVLFD